MSFMAHTNRSESRQKLLILIEYLCLVIFNKLFCSVLHNQIKWSVRVLLWQPDCKFISKSNSRGGGVVQHQRSNIRPAAQTALSQVCCAVWSFNRDSQQQLQHLHLMQTSSRLQPVDLAPRMTLNSTKLCWAEVRTSGGKQPKSGFTLVFQACSLSIRKLGLTQLEGFKSESHLIKCRRV